MAVGILGGAFDPPHFGHLELARAGVEHFGLDRLLVRVVEDPGHKEVRTDPSIRLVLAELAFAPVDESEVSLDPHPRTVDSLVALGLDDPVFLLGADEFSRLGTWKEPERVLELARLGVAARPGTTVAELREVAERFGRPDRVEFFPIDLQDVSSSEIRRRVAAGGTIEGLVPPAVAAEIQRLGLYRDG